MDRRDHKKNGNQGKKRRGEKYADEVRGEAEKKAEERAAKQMDFGGLDEDDPKEPKGKVVNNIEEDQKDEE